MYLIVYQTSNGLKARYLTTYTFYVPGDETPGGWKILSVGYYYDKKFIDKKTYSNNLEKNRKLHFKKIYFKEHFTSFINLFLKILLTIFLIREVIYKFFIYMLS